MKGSVMVIDFHTHTFPDKIASRVIESLSLKSRTKAFSDSSVQGLITCMQNGGIDYAVNLPVVTRPDQTVSINHSLVDRKEELFSKGIITFGGMHPDFEDYKQELAYLADHGIRGIKLHPAYQGRNIDDPYYLRIIECASDLGLIVVTHAGIDIGIYDHNYASVDQLQNVIRLVHPPKFVLAHMGGWACWDVFEKELAGAPVYIDTAFSIGPVAPRPDLDPPYLSQNLTVEDAVRIMRRHGTEKVLFATDSPWSEMGEYVKMIATSSLNPAEQSMIFSGNAKKLLGMEDLI